MNWKLLVVAAGAAGAALVALGLAAWTGKELLKADH